MTAEIGAASNSSEQPLSLYELDFYAWTQNQTAILLRGDWRRLDVAYLVEELESLGKQQRQELINRLGVLLGHLLKWQFQPEARSKSWFATLREQRRRISRLLQQNPSLQAYLRETITEAFPDAIDLVVQETPLRYKDLPSDCPYLLEQILDARFFPGQPSEIDDWN